MPRTRLSLAVLAILILGLLAPPTAQAAGASVGAAARAGSCHRTLERYPILHPGDRRPAVRTLQCVLNDAGYGPVVVDGWYGPQTRAAVRRVERGFEGAAPRPGRINNGFWVLLFGRQLPDRALRQDERGACVRTLQRGLRAAGIRLRVDGTFGPRTRRAVLDFQRSVGLRPTGVVGETTRFLLGMGAVKGRLD